MANIKLHNDEISRWHDNGIYAPARLIDCMDEISETKAKQVIKNIRLLDFVSDGDITILMATEGGSVTWGMEIVDAVKECNSKVIIHIVGPCWSMGAIIAQSADHIKMSENATMMIHTGQEEYPEDHPLNTERWVKENKRMGDIADNILFEKIKKKKPRFTKKQFDALLIFDTILPAKKAIEMGLVDEIAEHKEF